MAFWAASLGRGFATSAHLLSRQAPQDLVERCLKLLELPGLRGLRPALWLWAGLAAAGHPSSRRPAFFNLGRTSSSAPHRLASYLILHFGHLSSAFMLANSALSSALFLDISAQSSAPFLAISAHSSALKATFSTAAGRLWPSCSQRRPAPNRNPADACCGIA